MDLDEVADHFRKNRYYDRFDEKNWRQQLEEHPLLMSQAPKNPDDIPPLVEAIRELKYGEDCNSPKELAEQYKTDGNELFKQKRFSDSLAAYAKGLSYLHKELDETAELKSVLFSNRAACHVMMRDYQKAIDDCKEALRINPNNMRARQRMEESLYKNYKK